MKSSNICTTIMCILLNVVRITAQENLPETSAAMEKTLEYINKKLGGTVTMVIIKNRELEIKFYKSGVEYRTDWVHLDALDSKNISYSAEEKALILRCKTELEGPLKKYKGGCIQREIPDKGLAGQYGRINFELSPNNTKTINGLQKAFIHLIKLAQDEGYKGSMVFE